MINLILTGVAGRMGQAILNVVPSFPDIKIIGAVESKRHPQVGKKAVLGIKITDDLSSLIKDADVVVDFTSTESSITNLTIAAAAKKPIVIGTTGHNPEQRGQIISISRTTPVVYSPNMSIGVNTMWRLIETAVASLSNDYQIDIVETHHIHKKDAPSGTAKKILEIVAQNGGYDLNKDVFFHLEGSEGSAPSKGDKGKIRVKSVREGEVVGDHSIIFTNPYERLEITHRAFSREVFAAGALRAAIWVVGKPPNLYNMSDVLKL